MMNRMHRRIAFGAGLALVAVLATAQQAPRPGLTQERIDELSHKHDGYYGALAPQNLSRHRPKPGFNLTGTWFVDLRRAFSDFMYGPPYPEFFEAGQTALKEAAEARKAGRPYLQALQGLDAARIHLRRKRPQSRRRQRRHGFQEGMTTS